VTSTVNDHDLRFDAKKLGEMLGAPSDGFDVYVREDKSVFGDERLLELTCKLARKLHLTESRSMRKGEMMSLHRLLFCFVIKNIVLRGQGCNLADPKDILTNLYLVAFLAPI